MSALWFASALLPGGWASNVRVTHSNGQITAIAPDSPAEPGDERHGAALPGIANVHSHAFQRGMAGLAEHRGALASDNFWSWREIMYRFLDQLTPDDVEAIAAMAYLEMLESGFTWVGEFHYLHHDAAGQAYANPAEMAERIAAAAHQTGIGLTLLPVFYAHANFAEARPSEGQRRFINNLDSYARLLDSSFDYLAPGDRIGIAPHSLRAVTAQELDVLLSMQHSGPIHIHAAEQRQEVRDCLAATGQRPVEWLLDHAPVDSRWCLIHATHLTAAETEHLARSGAAAGLCPITEANLGDGFFPARRFLDHGGTIAIGTDSNVLIDPAQELRALEYGQRLAAQQRNVLSSDTCRSTGQRLYTAALTGGAQAVGAAAGLAPGHPADIVTLNLLAPALHGKTREQLLDSWIFAARTGCVDTVWRRGVKVVRDGQHYASDRITNRYFKTLDRILAA